MNQIYQMVWKIYALKNFNVNVDADADTGGSAIARPGELKMAHKADTSLNKNSNKQYICSNDYPLLTFGIIRQGLV